MGHSFEVHATIEVTCGVWCICMTCVYSVCMFDVFQSLVLHPGVPENQIYQLSTISPYSFQALFDVIPSLWSLCTFLPHLWSFCVWSLLHLPHLVHLCFICCPPPSFILFSVYSSDSPSLSSSFLPRVIPSSQSTYQNWQRRNTRLTSTRDKIWRALCGLMQNTLTLSSLAGSPKR